jgi:two-component system, chemotaxis family, chemotaxis protein CheY
MRDDGERCALIVDDSSALRSFLRFILVVRGFSVMEAENGRTALELLADCGAVDLALIDWNMPELGSIELLNAIRADTSFDDMRIMMVTTETELDRVKKALGSGADEYLMKPFNREMIEDKLGLMGL